MNKTLLVGRLAADPAVYTTETGIKYAKFTIAVAREYSKNTTDFLPCITWRHNATFVDSYLVKGIRVSIEGSLQSSLYEKDGSKLASYVISAEKVKILETIKESKKRQNEISEAAKHSNLTQKDKEKLKETTVHDTLEKVTDEVEKPAGDDVPWEVEL